MQQQAVVMDAASYQLGIGPAVAAASSAVSCQSQLQLQSATSNMPCTMMLYTPSIA